MNLSRVLSSETSEECAICLCPLNINNPVVINCNHKFHKDCILEAIKTKKKCPLCRRSISNTVYFRIQSFPSGNKQLIEDVYSNCFEGVLFSLNNKTDINGINFVDPNVNNFDGVPILTYAYYNKYTKIVELLIKHGARNTTVKRLNTSRAILDKNHIIEPIYINNFYIDKHIYNLYT